jgi:tripartite ATP-independent transporter DctM subunit
MPGMVVRGYNQKIAAGLIVSGASLAPIIPPSLLAIIVGSIADVSIAKLLIAGVVPGLMLGGIFLAYVFIRIALNPDLAPGNVASEREVTTIRELVFALVKTLPFALVIFSVMGLILLVTAAIYRNLSVKMLWDSVMASVTVSAMILAIMAMSKMFTQLLAFTGATYELVGLVADLGFAPLVMLFIMLAVPFILCMFIDTIAVILLTIPIYQPIVTSLEFEPVWFWLLFLINITLGAITPPFGYTLFAFKAVANDMTISDVYRATWPFVGLFLLGIAIIVAFPGIATWLPNLFG